METELLELAPAPASGRWGRRLEVLVQHWRARRAYRRPRRSAPDLWHVLDGSRAHVSGEFRSSPLVITVHDVIPWLQDRGEFPGVPRLGSAARALWRANGQALRRADALLCDSESSARDAQRCFGVAPQACRVVRLPLRPGMLPGQTAGESGRERLVMHVGNNGFYKNRRGVLEVFARLDPAAGARLAMAGPPPDEDLRRLASNLGIESRVDWIHDPDDGAIADLYARAAVLLFPSRYEGFGWPVLEAMAFGLPVVSSNAGSLPEVLGRDAPAFAPDDVEGMAGMLGRLLESPAARAEASARNLRRAAEFSERAFAEGTLETYAAVLAARPGAG
jgi:glycosyltransferase involved in cell wall biosynthesis